MDAPSRIIEKISGLPQVFQPSNALFLLDGNARWIDLSFECRGSFKLVPGPEFHRAQSQRQPGGRNCKARMHQNSTGRVHSRITSQISFAVCDALGNPDQFRPVALIGKLGRVVKYQNTTIRRRDALTRRLEMARQNVRFADTRIGEKTIRRLRVCPILANERDTLSYVAPHPLKQCAKSLAKSRIPKFTPADLRDQPMLLKHRRRRLSRPLVQARSANPMEHPLSRIRCSATNHNRFFRFKSFISGSRRLKAAEMWVIESW